jgi:hypothetical protein
MRLGRIQTGIKIEIVNMFTWDRYENHKIFNLFPLPGNFFFRWLLLIACVVPISWLQSAPAMYSCLHSCRSEVSRLGQQAEWSDSSRSHLDSLNMPEMFSGHWHVRVSKAFTCQCHENILDMFKQSNSDRHDLRSNKNKLMLSKRKTNSMKRTSYNLIWVGLAWLQWNFEYLSSNIWVVWGGWVGILYLILSACTHGLIKYKVILRNILVD